MSHTGHERRPMQRRLPLNFRYGPLATELMWRRKTSLRGQKRKSTPCN